MRSILYLFVLLFARTLAAQSYIQNAPPVQQAQQTEDCYTRNLDNGNAALRRGETREALRFFNEAKDCPDAQGNSRRQSELDTRIARCQEQLGLKKPSADKPKLTTQVTSQDQKRAFSNEVPVTRRNYAPHQDFLKDTVDNCFKTMVAEADRAFHFKFWEDAAALYRAAKNCADADQNDRQRMSEKINDCRDAAENELFAKQQEAIRQARHAIAANLADDAQALLRNSDRSLAFRLADFANQYVAPEDNLDCVQAMFDAWYYQAPEDSKRREDELYNPVFCYELADNLGENTQVKFEQQKDGSQWLWAFVPKTGDLFAWEMPSMKSVYSSGIGEDNGYTGFDFSPDGDLLFWGNKFFELRRGIRTRRVDLPVVSNWCFSARGDEFFYENIADKKIYVLNVSEAFAQQYARKGSKNANIQQPVVEPREIISDLPKGLLAMQYINGKFWLGFNDRIEVLGKSEPGKPWKREKTIRFDGINIPDFVDQKDLRLALYPKEGFAVLGCNQGCWSIPLAPNPDNPQGGQNTKTFENMYPIAISPSTHKMACEYTGNYGFNGFWLVDASSGDTLLRQHIPTYTGFEVMNGSFSTDARWVAAISSFGSIDVWSLQDAPTVWTSQLPREPDDKPVFSPDGSRLFAVFSDTLAILNTSESNDPEHFWSGFGQPLHGASDQWAMLQVSRDSAEARHLADGRSLRFPLKNSGFPILYDFDLQGEGMMAYLSNWNRVEVRSLKTGALLANKIFEGGYIGELHFVQGSGNLIVVQHTSMGESEIGQSSVKIWSPLHVGQKPRALRLHDYPVRAMAIEGTGSRAAFSNGNDIRIFDLQNIENEVLKIRGTPEEYVQAIAFRPNINLIAAAYSTGKVVFWNIQTGQPALQLQIIANKGLKERAAEITSIGFSQNGTILHIAISDGRLLAYALDPSYIRSAAQDGNRQLQSFDVEHIVRYNLEAALYYPGNFERLAESGDAPLVRSFFRHFRGQALESNNIVQVRDYCERAFYLYERLDENTKTLWRPEMRFMYEDYARKLLLRNNIREASVVINFIKREFKYDPVLLNAHMALLQREYAKASSLYSSYLLTLENVPLETYEVLTNFESVEKDLTQFRDYEIIDSLQKSCFCGTVKISGAFPDFCPEEENYPSTYLSATDNTLWEIFYDRMKSQNVLSFATKAKFLDAALEKARELARKNKTVGQAWLETVTLELAQDQRAWGVFEENTPESLPHFEKAATLLTDLGACQKISDTSRLSLLSSIYLTWGKQLLKDGKSAEAIAQFNLGFQSFRPLETLVSEDTSLLRTYYNDLIGPLFEKIGTAYLLEGYPNEARQAYDQANIYYSNGISSFFKANVSVFENDDVQALLDFGIISDPYEIGDALFGIRQIAEKFPEKRPWIDSFVPRLRSAWAAQNSRLPNSEIDYWLAQNMIGHFAAQAQWDSAAVWSDIALKSAKRSSERPKANEIWIQYWLNEHINVPYYLLLAGWNKPEVPQECFGYVKSAEDFIKKQDSLTFYYSNRELLKTNFAHALILRNQPGDHERALEIYKEFLETHVDSRGYDNWDLLEKDFREIKRAGAPWPELPELEETKSDE